MVWEWRSGVGGDEENDESHFFFGVGRWRLELKKQIWNGGQWAELEERRGGVGGRLWWIGGGVIQRIESVDNFRAHIIIQL